MADSGSEPFITVEVLADDVVMVRGDIDIAGGPVLDAVLAGLDASSAIVIDLEGVSFIDSSGLRSLLAASRSANRRSGSVVLRRVGPEIARLLQITGTADQFVIESHRE